MTPQQVARLAEWGIGAWVLALALVVAWSWITRDRLRGLLETRRGGGADPERVQMLVMFLGGVGAYAIAAAKGLGAGAHAFPDPPQALVDLFIGSHALYLGGKLSRTQRRT